MIVPGTIPGWKALLVARVYLIELREHSINNENEIAPDAMFSFEKGTVPIRIANTNDEVLKFHQDTTLGSSRVVPDRLIQKVYERKTKNYQVVEPQYDLKNVMRAKIKEINNNCRADSRNLTHDFSDIFAINQWDLGKCDATNLKVDVNPRLQPIELTSRRMPVSYKDDLKKNQMPS